MAVLAGDAGGTKSRFLLKQGEKVLLKEKFYNRYYESFSEVLKDFLTKKRVKISKACLGIAGPILHNRCAATNLPWEIDGSFLSSEFKIPKVRLINDMEANAYGISCLKKEEFVVLNPGEKDAKGHAALISAGTGLGEAGLFWSGKGHRPFATEGSHADFAPRNELEIHLLCYLKKKYGHVSYERAVSGMGIANLYRFLVDQGVEKSSLAVEKVFEEGGDPPEAISEGALKLKDKTCLRVMEWFISLYGAEAGNVALKFLSKGGLYVGGGIAPKILPLFKKETFMTAFVDKGRFCDLLKQIPVKIILNEETALIGAAAHASEKEF